MMDPQLIQSRLEQTFPGALVEVQDLTGGMDHFQVTVVSDAFAGKSLIDQHKMVYAPFAKEIGGPIHAFSVKTLTFEEYEKLRPDRN